jgi:hypothetical protein
MGVLSVDATFTVDAAIIPWNVPVSGQYMFYGIGEFGGGCLSLESLPNGKGEEDESNWLTIDQLTSPGRLIRYLVSGEKVRLILNDSTNSDIKAGIRQ